MILNFELKNDSFSKIPVNEVATDPVGDTADKKCPILKKEVKKKKCLNN